MFLYIPVLQSELYENKEKKRHLRQQVPFLKSLMSDS